MQTSVNSCTESLGRSVQKDILKLDPSAKKQNSVGELPVNQAENLVSSVAQSFATPQAAARQASLSITSSRSPLKLRSVEPVTPPSRLVPCPALLPPSVFPGSGGVFKAGQ